MFLRINILSVNLRCFIALEEDTGSFFLVLVISKPQSGFLVQLYTGAAASQQGHIGDSERVCDSPRIGGCPAPANSPRVASLGFICCNPYRIGYVLRGRASTVMTPSIVRYAGPGGATAEGSNTGLAMAKVQHLLA